MRKPNSGLCEHAGDCPEHVDHRPAAHCYVCGATITPHPEASVPSLGFDYIKKQLVAICSPCEMRKKGLEYYAIDVQRTYRATFYTWAKDLEEAERIVLDKAAKTTYYPTAKPSELKIVERRKTKSVGRVR